MRRSRALHNRLSGSSKLCLLPRKAISLNYDKKDLRLQKDILSHLLTMTFIARQVGYKVSLKVSGKEY